VVFLTGMAGYAGWVDLPEGLKVLQHPAMLAASGMMLFVEFFADKIPGVDTLWDLVHTVVRIPAGAALAAGVFGADQATWATAAALLGGTLAATSHVSMSLLGDGVVPVMLWLSWAQPMVFFAALAFALIVMVALVVVLAKFLRMLVRRFTPTYNAAGSCEDR
jgi:hypothetical protein